MLGGINVCLSIVVVAENEKRKGRKYRFVIVTAFLILISEFGLEKMGSPNISVVGVTENTTTPTTISVSDINVSDSEPYAEGEKVFAYHSIRLYEAKVGQVEYKQNHWRFFVHYLGWKKSWDEWVGMDRLMKHTEESKSTKFTRAAKTSNVARGRKRKNESVVKIPPTLRKQLVDDCEFITHLDKLVKLPRTPNVNDILKKYFDQRLKKCGLISDSVEEIMKGLGCYFDKALPVVLLYKNEHQQYQEACPNNITPSTIYDAEHLLRLFVKLPELMFHASIEEETVIELQAQLVDFLRFLQRNQSAFFLSTYHVLEDIDNSNKKHGD